MKNRRHNTQAIRRGQAIRALLTLLIALLIATLSTQGQNVVRDKEGNFQEIAPERTAKHDSTTVYTYTDSKGIVWPVFKGKRGGMYIGRRSKKTGNHYRKYLKTEAIKN